MKCLNFDIDCELFSKYRTILMGFGTIGVVLGHNLRWSDWPSFLSIPSRAIGALVFTEGFLFLSGLGLFYSFDNDRNIKLFLTKRIKRLYWPYLLMLLPFAVINLMLGFTSWSTVAIEATCIPWFFGMGGYWYVALTLLLYAIYPFVHKEIFKDNNTILLKWCILVLTLYISLFALMSFYPTYFSKVEIGLVKAPMFFIGMLIGYYAKNRMRIRLFFPMAVLAVIISFGWRYFDSNPLSEGVSGSMLRVLCMGGMCLIFNHFPLGGSKIVAILSWFGKYSLEIYLLHMMLYYLLVNISLDIGMDDYSMRLFTALNIPLAILFAAPVQTIYKCIIK